MHYHRPILTQQGRQLPVLISSCLFKLGLLGSFYCLICLLHSMFEQDRKDSHSPEIEPATGNEQTLLTLIS